MSERNDISEKKRFDSLRICVNFRAGDLLPSCGARQSKEIAAALEAEIAALGGELKIEKVHCMGKCHIGPTMKLQPGGPYLLGVQGRDVPRLAKRLSDGEFEEAARSFPGSEETE